MGIILLVLVGIATIPLLLLYRIHSTGKASLFIQLHEKLKNDEMFKKVATVLDCEQDSPLLNSSILSNETFKEYIDFLNSYISVGGINHFSKQDLETLFGRHSELLKRHKIVRDYIIENSYQDLARALDIKT